MVVWPNQVLQDQDAEAWTRVKGLFSDLGAELKLDVGLKRVREEPDENALVLVDEADKLFVDDAEEPPRKCKACVGFTATIPSGKEGVVVQNRLEQLKVKIWNELGYQHIDRDVDTEVASIEEFFEVANRGAKLVFCSAGKVLKVTQQAADRDLKVIQDCKDLARIRDMHGYCLIVTDESLMRGIDYRLQEAA